MRRDDDSDLEPRRRPKKKSNTTLLIVLLVAGVVGCVAVVGVGYVVISAMQGRPGGLPVAKKPIPRDEFKKKVMGKTPEEVLKAVGKPDSTNGDGKTGQPYWCYRDVSFDPINGKTDSTTFVLFENGRVESVHF